MTIIDRLDELASLGDAAAASVAAAAEFVVATREWLDGEHKGNNVAAYTAKLAEATQMEAGMPSAARPLDAAGGGSAAAAKSSSSSVTCLDSHSPLCSCSNSP